MIQRPYTLTQAEIDRAVARGRQLRAQAVANTFAWLRRSIRAGVARLLQPAAHGGARRA